MNKNVKIWILAWALFWLSLVITFLADTLGIFETSNLGFVEDIWISWITFTVGLGIALTVFIRIGRESSESSPR